MKYLQLIHFNNNQQQKSFLLLISILKKSKFRCIHPSNILLINEWISNNQNFIQLNKDLISSKIFKNKYFFIYAFIYENDVRYCEECSKIICFNEIDKRRFNKRFCSSSCSSSNKNVIAKYKETCIQRYNMPYKPMTEATKQKIKNTNIQRYNVDNPAKNKNIISRISTTCKQKLNSAQVKIKKQQTYLNKYNSIVPLAHKRFNKILSWNKAIIPLFDITALTGKPQTQYLWKCVKYNNIFKSKIYTTGYFCKMAIQLKQTCLPRCLRCYPFNTGFSNKQKQLYQFCKNYFPNLKENYRKLINPLQLDIVIPQIKLAIEFNGIYWHSLEAGIQENYHLHKTQLCEEKRYRLIHIWQDDWNTNKEEIKEKLIGIFENKEIIDIAKPLDRCWYSTLQFQQYEILAPELIKKGKYSIKNCGYLKIKAKSK